MEHILITSETCNCDKYSDSTCPVCDWGLSICINCRAAERELELPCNPKGATGDIQNPLSNASDRRGTKDD